MHRSSCFTVKVPRGSMKKANSVCTCGNVRLRSNAQVLSRIICHCGFCQEYTGASCNDEVFFMASDVYINGPENVVFRKYLSDNSPLSRGTCKVCSRPVISIAKTKFLTLILMPFEVAVPLIDIPTPSC